MDYYSTLGVSKSASDKELKQAYKKASMQHHPDRGGDENKFKEINEAYSTLKDPHKRGMYDHQQTAGQGGFGFNQQNRSGFEEAMRQANAQYGNNPFAGTQFEHHFQHGFGQQQQTPRNQDIHVRAVVDLLLGCVIIITTLDKKQLELKIPQGTKPGAKFSIPGYGLPNMQTHQRGNMYVAIDVEIPLITDVNTLNKIQHIKNEIQ